MNHSILLALLICNFFLQQWETWPSLSSVNLFNFSIPIHIYRGYCEMKIFTVISINKKCHSLWWFLASYVNKSSPNCHPIPDAATPAWGLLSSWGNTRSNHLPLLKVNKETGFVPRYLRCIWKECIQWAQRLASYTQNAEFLNLIPYLYAQIACSLCYIMTSPSASLEQSPRANWCAISWAAVLILPQIQLNMQLSSCAYV